MPYDRGRDVANGVPVGTDAPGQIGVLVVEEEVVIEPAEFPPELRADGHAVTAGGEHLRGLGELSAVDLLVAAVGTVAVPQHDPADVVDHINTGHVTGDGQFHGGRFGARGQGGAAAVPAQRDRFGGLAGPGETEGDRAALGHRDTKLTVAAGPEERRGRAAFRAEGQLLPQDLAQDLPAVDRHRRDPDTERAGVVRTRREGRGRQPQPEEAGEEHHLAGDRAELFTAGGRERGQQAGQPVGFGDGVVVEQDGVGGCDHPEREVVATGEAEVHLGRDEPDRWVALGQQGPGGVPRGVVDHPCLEREVGHLLGCPVQARGQQMRAVPVDDHDGRQRRGAAVLGADRLGADGLEAT